MYYRIKRSSTHPLLLASLLLSLLPAVANAQLNKEGAGMDGKDAKNGALAVLQPIKVPVDAKSGILMDAYTGQVLLENNRDLRTEPASFAKILTLYVVFDAIRREKLKLDDEVFISKNAWKTNGSKMFVQVNTKVPVREIIKGIAVVSGNDACVAISEHLYGSTDAFVNAMNVMAQKIGMQNSHFTNTDGLPDKQQYTTPYDMALLARTYISDFPEALQLHSMLEYTYAGIRQYNRNNLLRKDPSVDGLKTGYISDAGYHLLATAKRDNRRLIAVVMGAENRTTREREVLRLLNTGYQNFEMRALFTKDQVLAELPIWKGARNTVPVVATESGMLTVPAGYKGKVSEDRTLPKEIVAPISKGQVLGKAIIKIDSDIVKNIPLVASNDVQQAGFFKSLSHSVYLACKNNAGTFFIVLAVVTTISLFYYFAVTGWKRRNKTMLRI
jgi:D-alanyl-D-alanine carboxypeptidase (penicillin-binding protein 5/6)